MTRLRLVTIAFGVALLLVGAPAAGQIHSQLLAEGLDHPVAFVQDSTRPDVQYIVEQHGRVRVFAGGTLQPQDFLDLTDVVSQDMEAGLLGFALAPDYADTGRFFVNFIDLSGNTVIARFVRSSETLLADPSSRFDLMWPDGNRFIGQPACCHFGGRLAFGPDGYLYIGLGDGGDADDPWNNAQNPLTLLGKMLRVDVGVPDDDVEGYHVPADNPFAGRDGVLAEIWDVGLRNPFAYSFDNPARGGTGALIIADVGQDRWEEWNYEPAGRGGRNYGWRLREGANEYILSEPAWFDPLTDPTFQYGRDSGRCIIGGVVYRGKLLGPQYYGQYFFGDFSAGHVWSADVAIDDAGEATASGVTDHTPELGAAPVHHIVSISEDASGELYFLNWLEGKLYQIAAGPAPGGSTGSAGSTGCTSPDPFATMGGGTCIDGGWLPPGAAPPASTGSSGSSGSSGSKIPPALIPCDGAPPAPGWVCVNGGWLPPDHPLAIAAASGANTGSSPGPPPPDTTTSSCIGPDPFVSIPGLVGVCINGGWIPTIR